MRDVVDMYGLSPNRAGFIRCPFHNGDHTASMKIYRDNFHCFGCGADGDIFKFVMLMDGLSFKDAFIRLGGAYDKEESIYDARHRSRDIALAKQRRKRRQEQIEQKKKRIIELSNEAKCLKSFADKYEPLSERWCNWYEGYLKAMFEYETLWEEVNEKREK